MVVIYDARGIRHSVGEQAKIINQQVLQSDQSKVNEYVGHTLAEVVIGILVGLFTAISMYKILFRGILNIMSDQLLDTLDLPNGLKTLTYEQLIQLSNEIRHRLIDITNTVGGHLASNLGVVEITLALHTLFDSPTDKFLWDTSHQTYVHKMLTGRLNDMYTIKQYKGLSGFAKIAESDHDTFGAGMHPHHYPQPLALHKHECTKRRS